jgi:hypothetical protein
MSKKLKLLLLGITVVIAGFFIIVLFSNDSEKRDFYTPMYSHYSAKVEDPANYEFEERGDVTLVKNDNLGFSFEVPSDWNITPYYYEEEAISDEGVDGELIIHPSNWPESDFYHEAVGSINCAVGVFVSEESYVFSDETELRYEADVMRLYLESDIEDWPDADSLGTIIDDKIIKREKREDREPEYRKTIVEIDDYYGYGLFLESIGRISELEIPVDNKIYKIVKRFEAGDDEVCRDVYHNILKSISFTKNEN